MSAAYVPPELLERIFLPVKHRARQMFAGFSDQDFTRVTLFAIRDTDMSTGMQVAGWPMFTTCRVWLIEDFLRAVELAMRLAVDPEPAPASPRARRRHAAG